MRPWLRKVVAVPKKLSSHAVPEYELHWNSTTTQSLFEAPSKFQLYQNHKKKEKTSKTETKRNKESTTKGKNKTHHLCGLTAYCTKFSTFSLEWYSLLLRVQSRTLLYVRSFSSSWVAVLAVRCLAAELRMVWCPPLVDEVS